MNENSKLTKTQDDKISAVKKSYDQPDLRIYGKIQELTRDVQATSGEGASGMGMTASGMGMM